MRDMFDRLNTPYPIWNAGMGGALAGPELVAAVNAGGGFGVLGTGAMPPDAVSATISATRALTSKPIGANIILPMSDGSDIAAVFDSGVEVLVLFWGDPQPWVTDAHKRDIFVVAQCGDGEDASQAADAGVDAVIVQGTEAGGHVKATRPLAQSLTETINTLGALPVIASGGIADGAAIARALELGAKAVSIGTRFLASREAQASAAYKERLIAAAAEDTVMTQLFNLGWPNANHRVIKNRSYTNWEAAGRPDSGNRPGEGEVIGVAGEGESKVELPRYTVFPPAEGVDADIEELPLYAGQSVALIDDIAPVSEIMQTLIAELKTAQKN